MHQRQPETQDWPKTQDWTPESLWTQQPEIPRTQQLKMEEEREEEAPADPVEDLSKVSPGVRYLSEELIVKLSRQENLALVRTLNLSSKTGDKQFKVIEGLERCERLQVLKLNHNLIEKMERLNTLRQLRELHLAHNKIEKIEGLEHMSCLQHLNLAYNSIQHVPVWLGKKLQSLHTLNLQHNKLACLYELSRLHSLSSLSELVMSENPASSLPHSRLFLIYHVRALNRFDSLPITQEERKHAHQRFHTEELERLQGELDSSQAELARLSREQQAAVTQLHLQEEKNTTLIKHTQQQNNACTQLQQELHTNNQLLKQRTAELTRACHRQYELEQELTFHKIDAKFTPLPYCPQVLDCVDGVTESPYIGKARHTRKPVPASSHPPLPHHSSQETQQTADSQTEKAQTCPSKDDSSETRAEGRLQQLTRQIEQAEQQLSAVRTELRLLEETALHRQEHEAEKEALRQRLLGKLSLLKELRGAVQETERQVDRHTDDRRRTEREIELLQTQLDTLDNTHPKHIDVTAQLANRRQLLAMMSKKQQELEGRLDDMLSRIAMETQEIKELEQQLTDGQILANEALQRDLEGIISGLQEYLGGLREQAGRAQQRAQDLESENQALQRQLQDTQRHFTQLEADNGIHTQELCRQQSELSELRRENQVLRDRQADISQYQTELERQIQQHHDQTEQIREQLARTHTLNQLERGALQAGLDKERQARENSESQLQTATDTLTHRQHILDTLQAEKASLQQSLQTLQDELDPNRTHLDQTRSQLDQTRAQLDQTRTQLQKSRSCLEQTTKSLLDPQEVKGRLEHLAEALTSGQDSYSSPGQGDVLGSSLEQLYTAVRHYVAEQARTAREQAQQDHNQQLTLNEHNQAQLAQLQAQLARQNQSQEEQERLKEELERVRDRLKAAQTQLQLAEHSRRSAERSSRAELSCLREELECQGAELESSRQQLQEVQEARDSLLEQLRSESSCRQQHLRSLDRELRQLRRLTSTSDQLTNQQLALVSEQLSALHSFVDLIDRQREQKPSGEPDRSFLHSEGDSVRQASEREQALTHTVEELRGALATAQQHTHSLTAELELLRATRTSRRRGQWYYVPPGHNAPSLVSQGTVDSGVGLQFPSSPDRGRCSRRPPAGGGYWVYLPPTNAHTETEWRDSGGGSEADCSSSGGGRGGATPLSSPGPAPGLSAGLADSHGPLPAPAWLLYGSPPPEGAALHCNIPQHRDMQGDRCDSESVQRETERQEGTKMRLEIKQLRHTLRKIQKHSLGTGQQCVLVSDEVQCIELTLLKRRAELREADRLLLDAQTCLHNTRDKASAAQQRLSSTQSEVEEMERRAQDSASCLLEAKQQLRALEEEVKELRRRREEEREGLVEWRRRREEEEKTVREGEEMLRSRDQEYQELNKKILTATNRLRDVEQKECVLRSVCHETETLLKQHQDKLDSVNTQVEQQEQRLEERREEEQAALERLDQSRDRLQEVTEGQHRLLQELCVQQGEQEVLLCERRSEVASLREEAQREEHIIHTLRSEVNTHRAGLKQVLQQVLAEQQALEGVKIKHTQRQQQLHWKQDELDRKQEELDRKQEELVALQKKTDSHRKEVELCQKETEQQRTELQAVQMEAEQRRAELQQLQREVERERAEWEERRRERSSLEEQCKHLEARRQHADRCLSVVEAELIRLKEEQSHAHILKQEVVRDTAASQEKLHEESELLSLLSEQVEQRRRLLEAVDQELCASSMALQSSREKQQEAEQIRLQLEELQKDLKHTQCVYQSVCEEERVQLSRLKELTAAVTELEDRRHCLTSQQEQLTHLSQELQRKEEELDQTKADLKCLRAELEQRSSEHRAEENREKLTQQLCVQEQTECCLTEIGDAIRSLHSDIREGLDNLDTSLSDQDTPLSDQDTPLSDQDMPLSDQDMPHGNGEMWETEEEESLSLSMAGLRSAFSTADERWRGEVRRYGLRQQEDQLKARLRGAVWSQQDSLSQSRLQTEDCLLGLKQRLDQLDLLITHSHQDTVHTQPHTLPHTLQHTHQHTHHDPLRHTDSHTLQHTRSMSHPDRLHAAVPERDWT